MWSSQPSSQITSKHIFHLVFNIFFCLCFVYYLSAFFFLIIFYPRLIHLQDCIVQMFHAQTLKQHDRQWQLPIEVGFQVCSVHADALINESVMPCCE